MNLPMSSPPNPDFRGVLTESKRIINAHSRHFLALSLLFILPQTLSSTLYPTFQKHLIHESKALTTSIIYIISLQILSLCATGTITYSVLHAFYGRPINLKSAITSLSNSFFPLLITSLTSQVMLIVASFVVVFFLSVVILGIVFLGGEFSYNSPHIILLHVIALVFLVVGLVYLQVNWSLASVVVTAESSWGVKPLKRSTNLVRGARGVALSLLLYFGFFTGFLLWTGSALAAWLGGGTNGWRSWVFVAEIVVINSAIAMMLMLHSIAAITVFYIYCKAMHGELASEIGDREYISLPFDDEKVKVHLVSVIQP